MARTDWQFSQRTGNVGIVADYSTFAIHGYRDNSDTRRQQVNTVVTVDAKPDTRIKLIANIFDMPYAKDPLGLTASQYATNPGQAGNYAIVNGTQKTIGSVIINQSSGQYFESGLPRNWVVGLTGKLPL